MRHTIASNVDYYICNKINCLLTEKAEFDGSDYHLTLSEKQLDALKEDLRKAVMNIIDTRSDFMVMNAKGAKPPRFIHNNYESALKEAERLDKKLEAKSTVLLVYDDTDVLPF